MLGRCRTLVADHEHGIVKPDTLRAGVVEGDGAILEFQRVFQAKFHVTHEWD